MIPPLPGLLHPRLSPRPRRPWAAAWWAKAWLRAVEEAVDDQPGLRRARALARAGAVGGIRLEAGTARAAVAERTDLWSVDVALPVLDASARTALVEAVAAAPGRAAALLGGDLPHDLVEHAEELGVELLPYGAELTASCTCPAWASPCGHAAALLLQLGWLVEDEPLVLLHLRGVPREDLLAGLRAPEVAVGPIDIALDAAQRAARVVELLDAADREGGPPRDGDGFDHLW